MGIRLCSWGTRDTARRNSLKSFRLELGKFLHGKGGQAHGSDGMSIPGGIQSPGDVALGTWSSGGLGSAGNGWTPWSEGSFPTLFRDFKAALLFPPAHPIFSFWHQTKKRIKNPLDSHFH